MEGKWAAFAVAAFFVTISVSAVMSEYMNHQCRMAFAQSGRPADEIAKICK